MSSRGAGGGDPGDGLPEYRSKQTGSTQTRVLDVAEAWLEDVIASGKTLYEWAESVPGRREAEGRGTVLSVPAPVSGPDARSRWAVRHYLRGGMVASSLEDRYLRLGRMRPFRELEASATARARGVRTPAVICGAAYTAGAYYRADIVTEMVPAVRTLADKLRDASGDEAAEALDRSSRLITRLARAGVYHVDLNAGNVLLPDALDEGAWVVDLDRARVLVGPSEAIRERMCARLTRSLVKIAVERGDPVNATALEAVLSGS